jgi:hypothetical protein
VYLKGFEFTGIITDSIPNLTQKDITNIDEISHDVLESFWKSLDTLSDRKQIAIQQGFKIVGAAGEFDLGAIITAFMDSLSIQLTQKSINTAIVSSHSISDPRFQFFTVADSRVCSICQPLDQLIMSNRDDSLRLPPLHINCRCFVVPLNENEGGKIMDSTFGNRINIKSFSDHTSHNAIGF